MNARRMRAFTRFIVGCSFSVAVGLVGIRGAPSGFVLEIEESNPHGGNARLFYDIGQWYSVIDSCGVPIPTGTTLQPFRFTIPAQPIKHLRFDPADRAAVVNIGRIRLLTDDGKELARFGPEKLVPMHSILGFSIESGVAHVATGGDTPMLFIGRPVQLETELALGRRFVGSGQVLALGLIVAALIAVGAFAAIRGLVASSVGAGWVLIGSFSLVFGARLYWLKQFSHPLPYWDEWETDAIDLLIPLKGGYLDWQALFIPQGEHRILVTRLLDLGSAIWNGEWDPRIGMAVSAFFYAASLSLLCAGALKAGPRIGLAAGAAMALLSCLPFDVLNVYWGDQSQMYALNFLAVCTVVIAASEQIDPLTLFGACGSGLVSLFTMGSGFLAPAIAGAMCVAQLRFCKGRRLRVGGLATLFLAIAAIGIFLYRDAPYQGPAYARTWSTFWPAFVSRSAWPFPPQFGWAILLWSPWLVATYCTLFLRRVSVLNWFAVGIGAWAMLNAIGLAHGRPLDLRPFDSKYYTAMSLVIAGSVLSSCALASSWPARRVFIGILLMISLATISAMVPVAAQGLRASRDQYNGRIANAKLVKSFLATGNPTQLRETSYWELPYWNGAELADLLDTPSLQRLLPADIRVSATQRESSYVHGPQSPGALTVAVLSLMKLGSGIFVFGLALLVWRALRRRLHVEP